MAFSWTDEKKIIKCVTEDFLYINLLIVWRTASNWGTLFCTCRALRTKLIKQNIEHRHIHHAWPNLGSELLWGANMCLLISPLCLCLSSHSISFGTGCVQCEQGHHYRTGSPQGLQWRWCLSPEVTVSGLGSQESLCASRWRGLGGLMFFSGCCFPAGQQAGSSLAVLRKFTFGAVSFIPCIL